MLDTEQLDLYFNVSCSVLIASVTQNQMLLKRGAKGNSAASLSPLNRCSEATWHDTTRTYQTLKSRFVIFTPWLDLMINHCADCAGPKGRRAVLASLGVGGYHKANRNVTDVLLKKKIIIVGFITPLSWPLQFPNSFISLPVSSIQTYSGYDV